MILVEEVSFRYGQAEQNPYALDDVSLTIPEGEFLAIIGPNGSGKSTLGYCLNGLIQPTEGRISVDGIDTSDPNQSWEIHQRVGMIFQNPDNQLVSTTVERELAFGLENLGIPSREIQERVNQTLARFHLEPYRTHPPHRLSGGQKQRLAIAAVVAMQPRYLICDEPTTLLDPEGRSEILALIHDLHRAHGISVVYITQYPEEVIEADRVVVMSRGQIKEDATPDRIVAEVSCLKKYNLDIPQTVLLSDALRRRDIDLPTGIMHSDDVIAAIRRWPPRAADGAKLPEEMPPDLSSPHAIGLENVYYTYQAAEILPSPALTGVTFTVKQGSFIALIGPNGSGKSTLMQHLNGLLMPDAGTVYIDGIDLTSPDTDLTAIRQRVGLIFQFPEMQLFEETVFDDVAFGPRNLGIEGDALTDRVTQALERVKLDPDAFASRSPFTLSGGEKRRVAIAGILAMQPDLLVLDEPTAGLDAEGIRQIEEILKRFHTSGGTVILVSHDMDFVSRLADRILVLDQGHLVADDTPEKMFSQQDLLTSLSLQVPSLTGILTDMQEFGYSVNPMIFEVEAAADEILSHLSLETD